MNKLFLLFTILILSVSLINGQTSSPHKPNNNVIVNPQMNDYCRTCHTCENPTKFNTCLVECTRHGAQFSSSHTYKAGPEIVLIEKLSKLYKPVVFAHELHAAMSDISGGCTLCHHFSEKDGEIPKCSSCHKNKTEITKIDEPSLKGAYHRQCLGCHKEWNHDNACQFCHEEIDAQTQKPTKIDVTDIVGTLHPRIEAEPSYIYKTKYKGGEVVTFHHTDHVTLFGLKCTDCHKGDNCGRCHDIQQKKMEEEKGIGSIEHVSTCCKCHVEKNCNFCHSDRQKPPFNHSTATGFALGQYHNKVECNKCHGSADNFVTPSTTCTECHIHWEVGAFNHSTTGLSLNEYHVEEDCENCHLDRDFSIEPSCTNCHDDISYPDELPGDRIKN